MGMISRNSVTSYSFSVASLRAAKFLAGTRLMAVNEVGCCHSFLSLYLHFEQLKGSSAATSYRQVAAFDCDFTAL